MKCNVCNNEESVGVACVPGVPMSVSYGRKCLEANAHPWGVLVANTACIGNYDECAEWWQQMILDTCKHLIRTLDEFKKDVEQALVEEDAYFEKLKEEEDAWNKSKADTTSC